MSAANCAGAAKLMWEGAGGHFAAVARRRLPRDRARRCRPAHCRHRHQAGHAGHAADAAVAGAPATIAALALALAAILAVVVALVRFRMRRMIAAVHPDWARRSSVIAIDDASFLGGVRPFDGGDDGLFYDGVGRLILQKLLAGDIWGALEGGEKVFYYGGPGLRYFRALEHIVFGESYLGYLSLVFLLPIRRPKNFPPIPARALVARARFCFLSRCRSARCSARASCNTSNGRASGFADPAAYIFFICAVLPIVGASAAGPSEEFLPAFFGALLLALAIFMKPIVAPAAAVLLGGAGLAALYQRQWPRLAALCIGFLPVFSMALHNWVFGHVLRAVQLQFAGSQSAGDAALRLCGGGARIAEPGFQRRSPACFMQMADWLSGPAESYWTIPLNAAGVVILVYVVVRGRSVRSLAAADRRGGAGAARGGSVLPGGRRPLSFPDLVSHHAGGHGRLCTRSEWAGCERRYPALSDRIANHPWSLRLASGLTRLQKMSA